MIDVLGVFIGLRVNKGNQVRHDRAPEQQYIERLRHDMAGSVDDMREQAKWNETLVQSQDVVLDALRSGRLPGEERQAFESGLALMGHVSGPRVRWTTVDELQSTGNMNVLRDIALREQFGRTYAEFTRKVSIDDVIESRIAACRQEMDGRFGVLDTRSVRMSDIKLDYDFPALAADREFVNLASRVALNARVKKLNSDNEIKEVEKLRDELVRRLPDQDRPGGRR